MAHSTGICILTKTLSVKRLERILIKASSLVSKKIYLRLPSSDYQNPSFSRWKKYISVCYSTAHLVCPGLDVCLLLPHRSISSTKSRQFEVILTDSSQIDKKSILAAAATLGTLEDEAAVLVTSDAPNDEISPCVDVIDGGDSVDVCIWRSVCLGGTFDKLHTGHRILLSVAALLAECRLLVGVTDKCLLENKLLAPLIETYELRCRAVADFFADINYPAEQIEFACLTDPFGPPILEPDFDCIVASPDSISGCQKINEIRAEKSFPLLHIETIQFAMNTSTTTCAKWPSEVTEEKISSSSNRLALLGQLLRSVNVSVLRNERQQRGRRPYVVGLVGPAGSGKSSITRHLVDMAGDRIIILHADQIAHVIYEPGTKTYFELIELFAPDKIICDEAPHQIDRKRLGSIVFSSPDKLAMLNKLVWPEISNGLETEIKRIKEVASSSLNPLPVALIDAALLFDAGWDKHCDEIWMTYVARDVCEQRLAERQHISLLEAQSRIRAQSVGIKSMVGDGHVDWWTPCQLGATIGPVAHSHVVFCSQWKVDFTRSQVELAWNDLISRLSEL